MKRRILGVTMALALLVVPARASALPFQAVFSWEPGPTDAFTLEFLNVSQLPPPADLQAEVVLSPQVSNLDDPYCLGLGNSQPVLPVATFAFCQAFLRASGQDTYAVEAGLDSATLHLFFAFDQGAPSEHVIATLRGPGALLIGAPIAEPPTLALVGIGLASMLILGRWHRRPR